MAKSPELLKKDYSLSYGRYDMMRKKEEAINGIRQFAETFSIKPDLINSALENLGTAPLRHGCKLIDLINRPQITIANIAEHIPAFKRMLDKIDDPDDDDWMDGYKFLKQCDYRYLYAKDKVVEYLERPRIL